jgi:hypothetical protein
MPLVALSADGSRLESWTLDEAAWAGLKQARGPAEPLRAACCGAPVTPVTSPLGLQFFRHHPGTGCPARETAEHLACKVLVARVAAQVGWTVSTEVRHPESAWVADVLATRGRAQVAIEIQLARTPLKAIERRHARYAADGVRAAWLVGFPLPGLEPTRALPAFCLSIGPGWPDPDTPAPTVSALGGDGLRPTWSGCLSEFVPALLGGRVRFTGSDGTEPICVETIATTCWRCHRDIDQMIALVNVPPNDLFCPKSVLPLHMLARMPEVLAQYRAGLPGLLDACPDLAVLRPAIGTQEQRGPVRVWCPHCNASIVTTIPDRPSPAKSRRRYWNMAAGREYKPSEAGGSGWLWS